MTLLRRWNKPSETGPSHRCRFGIAVAVVGALFALVDCTKVENEQSAGSLDEASKGREQRPPDILLITVDTLRADHLGIYGYRRRTSPNLDRSFSKGAVFEAAYSTQTHTAPSVISILSGQLPQTHRVRMFFQLLPEDTSLLVDHLADGYQTAAFVSNTALTDEAIGLAKRFDHYDDFVDEKEPYRLVYERNARRTTDAVLRWLEEERVPAQPLFLWVHYMDPHGPYHPPADWPLTFAHETPVPIDVDRVPAWVREPNVTDGLEYVDRYDEEIAFLDAHVGRLLERFDKHSDPNRPFVLFTADHGETMMEHELWFAHGYHVYQELVRVPLMIRGPGIDPGLRLGPASGIDLAPTILAIAGVEIPAGLPGLDLLQSENVEPSRTVFAEASWGKSHWRAAIGLDHKWVIKVESGHGTVLETFRYDLKNDSGEQHPRESHKGDRALRELLALVRADPDPGGLPIASPDGLELKGPKISPRADAEALEKLRALGYIN